MVDQNFTIQCSIVLHNNMANLWNSNQEIMVPIFVTMEMVSIAIYQVPERLIKVHAVPNLEVHRSVVLCITYL